MIDAEALANKEFASVKKGWDPDEVRSYLHVLADELRAVAEENSALRKEILDLETQLAQSEDMERRVWNMLTELQNASVRLTQQTEAGMVASTMRLEQERKLLTDRAKHEAEIIVRDAERRAERVVAQGNERYGRLQEQIDLLEAKKIALVTRIKSILRAEVDFLEALEHGAATTPKPSTLKPGVRTREGLYTDELNDIIERLD